MERRGDLLKQVMNDTQTTQSALARISGIRQPSISQFLSGRTDLSDDQLDRLLTCMGYRLEVSRRATRPHLTKSERRSWQLHRHIAEHLTPEALADWRPLITNNLERLRHHTHGEPHTGNIANWEALLAAADLHALRRVLTGLDRLSIEMREVSPMSGVLTADQRATVLAGIDKP